MSVVRGKSHTTRNRLEIPGVLLDAGVLINQQTGDNSTPLPIALQNAHLDLARVLIERDADVNLANRKDRNPLYMAVQVRNQEIGRMPSPDAGGMYQLIEPFITKDARISNGTEVHDAIASTWLSEAGGTSLLCAAWYGDLEVIEPLMTNDADPFNTTHDDTTALMAVVASVMCGVSSKAYGGRDQLTRSSPPARVCVTGAAVVAELEKSARTILRELCFKLNNVDQHFEDKKLVKRLSQNIHDKRLRNGHGDTARIYGSRLRQ